MYLVYTLTFQIIYQSLANLISSYDWVGFLVTMDDLFFWLVAKLVTMDDGASIILLHV